MIKFFRKIRQRLLTENRFSKYLLYAIGEIILVVIGILIALQINNWNEQLKSIAKEKDSLIKFIENLKIDSTYFCNQDEDIEIIKNLHREIYLIGVKEKQVDSIENRNNIRSLLQIQPISKLNQPFITNEISNENIREEIAMYFNMLSDLDVANSEFSNVVKNRLRIYLAQENVYNLSQRFENTSNEYFIKNDALLKVAKQKQFQQILFECNLKLEAINYELDVLKKQNEILKKAILSYLNNLE